MKPNFQQTWQFLDELQFFKIKLGLDSMNSFLDSLGHPHLGMKFLHVAGTNGKGSVAATVLTILAEAGYRVGLYTSPHLSSVRERFRINHDFISEQEFAEQGARIIEVLDGRQITYFEFTTTLAMLWFAQQDVDLAILEVGMGGRLDATNVITPLVSVITNVSMDHEMHLGDTLAKVAYEKAGIIKSAIPLVTGVAYDESRQVVLERSRELGAPSYLLGRDFTVQRHTNGSWDYHPLSGKPAVNNVRSGLPGAYQADNGAVALASLELLQEHGGFQVEEDHVRQGLRATRWPGRLEYQELEGRRYLLDGAHNPAGVASLQETLATEFPHKRLILVWASMADKDISKSLSPMIPLTDTIILTMPEQERSARPQAIMDLLPRERHKDCYCLEEVEQALGRAAELAGPDDLICIAGSLYLVGKARRILFGEVVG